MSRIESNLRYTEEHEWVRIEGDDVVIGITDFAQSSLGDIVFVELPEAGTMLNAGEAFGVVESIKSVSDLYSPVTGKILEKNEDLESTPESINNDAYTSWMLKVSVSDAVELEKLMDAEQYKNFCASNS